MDKDIEQILGPIYRDLGQLKLNLLKNVANIPKDNKSSTISLNSTLPKLIFPILAVCILKWSCIFVYN